MLEFFLYSCALLPFVKKSRNFLALDWDWGSFWNTDFMQSKILKCAYNFCDLVLLVELNYYCFLLDCS